MVKSHEIYRIYQCPRCTHMESDINKYYRSSGRILGICKSSKLPIRKELGFNLKTTPEDCLNWSKGKAKEVKNVS